MPETEIKDESLARELILDELFDLSLYRVFRDVASGPLKKILEELILVETRHHAFWEDFFKMKMDRLDFGRRFKLQIIAFVCKLFGERAVYLILEAIEVYGIRKYLRIWDQYRETPLAGAVQTILRDEFEHEDAIVSGSAERRINPERIRSIFLGFNDGLVEFMGAVSGFFAAFQDTTHVLLASFTAAAAGAISMAIGSYLAAGSEKEMRQIEHRKERFLSGSEPAAQPDIEPLTSAILVGFSFLIGSMFPILPVLFGAKSVLISWLAGGTAILLVSTILAFLSGTEIRKRVFTNLVLIALAVAVAYGIGAAVKIFLGINV